MLGGYEGMRIAASAGFLLGVHHSVLGCSLPRLHSFVLSFSCVGVLLPLVEFFKVFFRLEIVVHYDGNACASHVLDKIEQIWLTFYSLGTYLFTYMGVHLYLLHPRLRLMVNILQLWTKARRNQNFL